MTEKDKDHYAAGIRIEARTVMANVYRSGFTISAELCDPTPFTPVDRNLLLNSLQRLLEVIRYDAETNGDVEAVQRIDQGIGKKMSDRPMDPADELMDYLGLPREHGSRALWEAAQQSVPVEFWGKWTELGGK